MDFFKKLQKNYTSSNRERQNVIKISNDILNLSKRAIFSFHRGKKKEGTSQIRKAERMLDSLEKKIARLPRLRREGAYRAALEEYVEAKFFGNFLRGKKIEQIREVKVDTDSYIAGLCDFTGEVVRKAVNFAADKKISEVEKCENEIEIVISELIQMDLTGYLRTKYDQAKTNLKKIEQLLYEVKR